MSAPPKGRFLPAPRCESVLSSAGLLHHRIYTPGERQFTPASAYRRTPPFLSDRFRLGSVQRLDEVGRSCVSCWAENYDLSLSKNLRNEGESTRVV
jgi:hypothetical protein